MDYYTLTSLASEWSSMLAGAEITAVWTQNPGELSISLESPEEKEHTLRVHCDSTLPLLFRAEGAGRQRKNTVDVFGILLGRRLTMVRTASLDRYVFLELEEGAFLQVRLFGPRPNVFLVKNGAIREMFLQSGEEEGEPAPAPRPAPDPQTAEAFAERWNSKRKTVRQAISSVVPLVPNILAVDAARRAKVDPDDDPARVEPSAIWPVVEAIRSDLENPVAHVLWRGNIAEALLPTVLRHLDEGARVESFDSFDEAADVFARRSLAQRSFQSLYKPLERDLSRVAKKRRRSADAMQRELQRPSRADDYERDAHLLMAQAADEGPGHEEITLPNILDDSEESVTISLDPALTAVENAERLYDKARRSRRSREEAEARWAEVQEEAETAEELLKRLRAIDRVADLEEFMVSEEAALKHFISSGGGEEEVEPFHRKALPGDVEAWIGKNARGNVELISKYAGPHDYWLHARGVPGSHVVIRRPAKTWEAPKATLHAAAQLAAWHSKARTQPLAPVIVTERKYVRPVKGGPPGRVHVDREEVLMVEPSRKGG